MARLRGEAIAAPARERAVRFRFPEPPHAGAVALVVEGLTKSYGGPAVFEDMAFDLQFFLRRDWETRRHFMQFHSKAHVRFVAAVRSNSILIQHVRKRRFGLDACDSTSTHHHVFDHAEDVFLPWK